MDKFKPLKMCVDKMTEADTKHLRKLKTMSPSGQQYTKLRAAFFTSKLWPNNFVIKIAFMEEPTDIERTTVEQIKERRSIDKLDPLQYKVQNMDIKSAIKLIVNERIAPITNLKFIFTDKLEEANVRISFDPIEGAWSLLGTDCLNEKDIKKPTMNLGWFDVPTTIHEFGHTLGMIHEHQNPDGNTIDWDEQKVYNWALVSQKWDKETTYTNIIQKYQSDQINGSKFDPLSIMLYFFPGTLTKNGKGTDENLRLSPYDAQYINSMYPDSPKTVAEFYMNVYGEKVENPTPFPRPEKKENTSTEKIIQKSNALKVKQENDRDIYISKEIVYGFLISIGLILLIYILVKFIKSKQ